MKNKTGVVVKKKGAVRKKRSDVVDNVKKRSVDGAKTISGGELLSYQERAAPGLDQPPLRGPK